MELYLKYRPQKFSEMVGQESAVKTMVSKLKSGDVPRVWLFTGPSGVGKTTLSRILVAKLGCAPNDFNEINCADARGIDTVRDIRQRMQLAPSGGKCRIWLLDEFHRATSDSMSALLKMFEDTPRHVFFLLCTTDPQKILKTIHTRCTQIALAPVGNDDMTALLQRVAEAEQIELSDELASRICDAAEGSPRKALVLLNQVKDLETEAEKLEAVLRANVQKTANDLVKLLFQQGARWPEVAGVLKDLDNDQEAEQTRRRVLGYARAILLSGDKGRAARACSVIVAFEGNFFDGGSASLARASYEVFREKW